MQKQNGSTELNNTALKYSCYEHIGFLRLSTCISDGVMVWFLPQTATYLCASPYEHPSSSVSGIVLCQPTRPPLQAEISQVHCAALLAVGILPVSLPFGKVLPRLILHTGSCIARKVNMAEREQKRHCSIISEWSLSFDAHIHV